MTQFGQGMTDLSKGILPITVVGGILATALTLGVYLGGRNASQDTSATQLSELKIQVQNLSSQVTQISVAIAKGPILPENVAFKADLLRLCLANKNLICPSF